jgi:YidC/Oxa1 family membrane protein insertase
MKNRFKILVLVFVLLLTSGCGNSKYIQDKDKKIVTYEETGQMLEKDILCLPEKDSELYNIYKEYSDQLNIDFEDLPACTDFKITSNESSGLWEFLFVKPLAYLILVLGKLVGNLGISLILIGLAIRLILLPFTIKSTKQTMNMKKAGPELEKLERKYRNRTDNESLMAKSQETMMIYKKYKVNPMVGCLMAFIQLPLFFAFLQAIYRTPAIYEESLLTFNLGMTPLVGIKTGNYLYLLLLVLIAVSTYFSFKQTMSQAGSQSPEAAKQMKIMLYVMLVVITYASLTLPTALAFYWIVTYAFIAVQNIIMNKVNNKDLTNKKENKKDKIKDKLVKKEGMKYGKNN